MTYPKQIDVCEGKYSVIYDFDTGQSEALRYGEKWRDLCGDKLILALFDEIVTLREALNEYSKGNNPSGVAHSAADTLTANGVFKGAHGLEGLANAQEFWDRQPYGTRLYYGDRIADYLHRDVLRAAVRALTPNVERNRPVGGFSPEGPIDGSVGPQSKGD